MNPRIPISPSKPLTSVKSNGKPTSIQILSRTRSDWDLIKEDVPEPENKVPEMYKAGLTETLQSERLSLVLHYNKNKHEITIHGTHKEKNSSKESLYNAMIRLLQGE